MASNWSPVEQYPRMRPFPADGRFPSMSPESLYGGGLVGGHGQTRPHHPTAVGPGSASQIQRGERPQQALRSGVRYCGSRDLYIALIGHGPQIAVGLQTSSSIIQFMTNILCPQSTKVVHPFNVKDISSIGSGWPVPCRNSSS